MRSKLALVAAAGLVLFVGGASSADSFAVHLVSETNSTITLGWSPQPGYGYLFSADGQLVARTYDATRSSVKFSKATSYDIDVITKGANGHYPVASPPPPPPLAQCADGVDNDGDGKVDYPADPGCTGLTDNDETDPVQPPPGCNLNATTSNFAAQVAAATAGQTVCLASGNYGTWGGTNKAVTVRAAAGATPQMRISFGSGAQGFTLEGMGGMGGDMNGAKNVTVRNSTFTGVLNIAGGGTDGIVLDGNTHNWQVGPSSGGPNAKLYLENSLTGTLAAPSVTIRNSQFKNGDLDGVHLGGGSGYLILNNVFDNLCDQGANHTDNLQFDTSVTTQVRIAGNYVHALSGCGTQGITSYDHGTSGVLIENNVVDIRRPWAIELYADVGSTVRHNTLVYYPSSQCDFGTACGKVNVTNKSGDPVSTGTQVYDNLATPDIGNCNGCSVHHNASSNGAVYVGPTTTHDGFLLATSSPVGRGAASDGTDAGVYAKGT